jgi:tRNA (uracil-5-)-methyltransferase
MEELTVAGRALSYKQLEGGFTQPNAGVAAKMLEWARDAATRDAASEEYSDGHAPDGRAKSSSSPSPRADDFLELYCGNGNFTIALAPLFRRVLATEVSKVSVRAALENLAANDVRNVSVVRLSSEELTQALDEKRRFERLGDVDLDALRLRTVLVDPPRAGMGPEVTEFVSRFPRIIYVSCNPETLAEDARGLAETHDVARFAAFDQFPYTPHLECGALFIKREEDGASA